LLNLKKDKGDLRVNILKAKDTIQLINQLSSMSSPIREKSK